MSAFDGPNWRGDAKTPKEKADHGMSILDALADKWAAETALTATIKNAVSPMRLNRNAPDNVRDGFAHRMEVLIDTIARQAFVEGAYRAVTGMQDERAEMIYQGMVPRDLEAERSRCAEIARSLAYGDDQAVKDVCESIATAIEMGAIVGPVTDSRTP